jgi:hypothetical protein
MQAPPTSFPKINESDSLVIIGQILEFGAKVWPFVFAVVGYASAKLVVKLGSIVGL